MAATRIKPEDIETINGWLTVRNYGGKLSEGWIPPVGYWVPNVVSCFLYQTDARKVAYIDGFCGNPDVPKAERHAAMILVGKALCEHAKKLGIEIVLGTTTFRSIADTATACEFDVSPFEYTYMSKRLEKGNECL